LKAALRVLGALDVRAASSRVASFGWFHPDHVSAEVSKGIAAVSLDSGVPVIFGILTTDSIEQAIERAGTKSGNKGWSAAISAVEMANLLETLG